MKYVWSTWRAVVAGGITVAVLCSAPAMAEDVETVDELRRLKARIRQLEERIDGQDRKQSALRVSVQSKQRAIENRLKRVAFGPPTTSTTLGPVGIDAKPKSTVPQHWYERLSIRGYVQGRFNGIIDGDRRLARLPGDRSVGIGQNFLIRRARLILSGDVSEHLFVYLQPDFASTPSGSNVTTSNFAQLRDAYADIYFDDKKEFRVRAGQSKFHSASKICSRARTGSHWTGTMR